MSRLTFVWVALLLSVVTSLAVYGRNSTFDDQHVPLRDDATLRSVTFADENRGWAVGDRGAILVTSDGGETWQPQESGVTCRLDHVGCLDAKRVWAVGGWYEPLIQQSHGMILWSNDGGIRWRTIPNDLPYLRCALFASEKQGTVMGDWSGILGCSSFSTIDGGVTWQPDSGADFGPVVDATDSEPRILLDRQGNLWRRNGLGPAERLQSATGATTVGHAEGILLAAGTGILLGGTSQTPLAAMNDVGMLPILPQVLAPHRGTLLVAGIPANRILRVAPQQPTSHVNPGLAGMVCDLQWIDSDRCIAVGSHGGISLSESAGERWRVVRGAQRRTGLLVLSSHLESIPWGLVASESLQHGGRVSVLLFPEANDDKIDDPFWPGRTALMSQAGAVAGVNDVAMIPATSQQDAVRQLLESWHPAAICLSLDLNPTLREQVTQAVIASPLLTGARVVEIVEQPVGWYRLDPAAALTNAGMLASDPQRVADALSGSPAREPRSIECRPLLNTSTRERLESLTARLPADVAATIRKLKPQGTPRQLARLQARTQFPEMIQRLYELHSTDRSRFKAQLQHLVAQVGGEDRDALILGLAETSLKLNDWQCWTDTISVIATSNTQDALQRWATQKHHQLQGSREWARARAQLARAETTGAIAQAAANRRLSPFEQNPVGHIEKTSLQSTLPATLAPQMLHQSSDLLSAFRETTTDDLQREKRLLQLASINGNGIWGQIAREELGRGELTSDRWHLPAAGLMRPRLDGYLDDALWKQTKEIGGVRIAYDAQFIYLAIESPFLAVAPASQRARDEDLDAVERLVIEFDIDRDLATAFRFEIDASGRTRDSVDGFFAWNPRWFVAVGVHESNCNMEVAIQRSDLTELPPMVDESWRLRIRKRAPNETLPMGPTLDPFGWTLATFQ